MNADFEVIVNVTKSSTTLPAIEALKNDVIDLAADSYIFNSIRHKKTRFSFPLEVFFLIDCTKNVKGYNYFICLNQSWVKHQ